MELASEKNTAKRGQPMETTTLPIAEPQTSPTLEQLPTLLKLINAAVLTDEDGEDALKDTTGRFLTFGDKEASLVVEELKTSYSSEDRLYLCIANTVDEQIQTCSITLDKNDLMALRDTLNRLLI